MRNIGLSTTVTILVEPDRRANANGLVGMVQGLMFIVTSVLSGLSVGLLGMGWTDRRRAGAHGAGVRAPAHAAHARGDAGGRHGRARRLRPARLPRRRAGHYRAVCADPVLHVQQLHRWRLHGADGSLRPGDVPRGAVGDLLRGRRHRVHRGRRADRQVRTRVQPAAHHAHRGDRDGGPRCGVHTAGVGLAVHRRHLAVPGPGSFRGGRRADGHPAGGASESAGPGVRIRHGVRVAAAPITAFLIAPIAQVWIIPYARSADGRRPAPRRSGALVRVDA